MVNKTSKTSKVLNTSKKIERTNSALKYDSAQIIKEVDSPVVKVGFKSFLDEMFGFIKVGGDLG